MLNLIAADVVVAELSKSCFTHFEGGGYGYAGCYLRNCTNSLRVAKQG